MSCFGIGIELSLGLDRVWTDAGVLLGVNEGDEATAFEAERRVARLLVLEDALVVCSIAEKGGSLRTRRAFFCGGSSEGVMGEESRLRFFFWC